MKQEEIENKAIHIAKRWGVDILPLGERNNDVLNAIQEALLSKQPSVVGEVNKELLEASVSALKIFGRGYEPKEGAQDTAGSITYLTLFNAIEKAKSISPQSDSTYPKAISEGDLIEACRYGYDYHKTTQFPEMEFDEMAINNFKQVLSSKSLPSSEADAVGFAEWIAKQGYIHHSFGGWWYVFKEGIESVILTTQELYTQYKLNTKCRIE